MHNNIMYLANLQEYALFPKIMQNFLSSRKK